MTNRSKSWKFAKENGHRNEENIYEDSLTILEIKSLLDDGESLIPQNFEGGKTQKKQVSIFGHKSTPKIDNRITTTNRTLKVSTKMSKSGQVYLISTHNFLNAMDRMMGVKYRPVVKKVLELFTGEDSQGVKELLSMDNVRNLNMKVSKSQRDRRLNLSAIKSQFIDEYDEVITYFNDNIFEITKMVFSTGIVKDEEYHADYLLYKNTIDPNKSGDKIFPILDLQRKCVGVKITEGQKYGGTSLQLPFGHLQMHQGKLQFHHDLKKINDLFEG